MNTTAVLRVLGCYRCEGCLGVPTGARGAYGCQVLGVLVLRVRAIPSIEQLRQRPAILALEPRYGRSAVVEALRAEAAAIRGGRDAGTDDVADAIERAAIERLAMAAVPSLRRVINATGVIIHTNLGRAPLARVAPERVAALAAGYTNLEYDLAHGARGKRDVHAERLLCRLTGAEAAVVVNNNAAATLLVLAALAAGREVIISRGELVEIGGGFRVPDVLAQSGAILREVGTTNRTRAADYAAAISRSHCADPARASVNFRIEGFTERPQLDDLVALGRRFNLPVAEDLGSGYFGCAGAMTPALRDEPIVSQHYRRRRRRRHVQRRQAARRTAGRNHRRAARRWSTDSHAPADARAARRQAHLRGARGDARGVRGRPRALHIPVAAMIAMPLEEIDRRARAIAASLSRRLARAASSTANRPSAAAARQAPRSRRAWSQSLTRR